MSNPDRLTAIKADLELLKGEELSFRQMREVRHRIERVDLPWAVSRLEQLQEDVQGVLNQWSDKRVTVLHLSDLLQAALDRSKS